LLLLLEQRDLSGIALERDKETWSDLCARDMIFTYKILKDKECFEW